MKQGIAHWCGPRPDDPKPIVYLSGGISESVFVESKYPYLCCSHMYDKEDLSRFHKQNPTVRVLYDSGAYSFHVLQYGTRKSGKPVGRIDEESYLRDYVKWVKLHRRRGGHNTDFYVTLDYRHDCSEIFKTTSRLYKMGIKPIPVYHGDDSIEWLQRYHDLGHTLVGISMSEYTKGKNLGGFYDRVFNFGEKVGMRFHGFKQTGKYMFAFPWWSVDSTSWIKAAAFGAIFLEDEKINARGFRSVSVSSRSDLGRVGVKAVSHLQKVVYSYGWDLDHLSSSREARALYNIEVIQRMSNSGTHTQRWCPLF